MISGSIQEVSDLDLISHFSKFGPIAKVTRKRDPKNPGKYQHFAFIIFVEPEGADSAIAQDIQHSIKGSFVDIRRVKDL